jgi:SAM-dependent methyltransferase
VPLEPYMTAPEQSSAKGYDPLYAAFDSPLMRQLRQEAYGEDIGQHSWVTADEFRSDIDRLSLTTSSRLLDLGCGPCGPLVFAVKSTGCMGTGLDVSAPAIGSGRARALAAGVQDRVVLLEADLTLPIPFNGSSFDAAISLDVIVHLPNRKALFHEMARLLVPTGRLLLTDAGVITGPISNEEVERRSVNGYMQFVPPGVNEELSRRSANNEEKHHHSLQALAIREKRIHIVGSPDLRLKGTAIYLDVEELPDRDFYYLIGHGSDAATWSISTASGLKTLPRRKRFGTDSLASSRPSSTPFWSTTGATKGAS